ncbi:unnamed protein product, partial [Didymodactylos carnosus]
KFGVTESEMEDALMTSDRHDQLVIAYRLIIDNKRIWNEARKAEIADFFASSSPPHSPYISLTLCVSDIFPQLNDSITIYQ